MASPSDSGVAESWVRNLWTPCVPPLPLRKVGLGQGLLAAGSTMPGYAGLVRAEGSCGAPHRMRGQTGIWRPSPRGWHGGRAMGAPPSPPASPASAGGRACGSTGGRPRVAWGQRAEGHPGTRRHGELPPADTKPPRKRLPAAKPVTWHQGLWPRERRPARACRRSPQHSACASEKT